MSFQHWSNQGRGNYKNLIRRRRLVLGALAVTLLTAIAVCSILGFWGAAVGSEAYYAAAVSAADDYRSGAASGETDINTGLLLLLGYLVVSFSPLLLCLWAFFVILGIVTAAWLATKAFGG